MATDSTLLGQFLSELQSVESTANSTQSSSLLASFCAHDSALTSANCDAIFPAVSFDPLGNLGVAWQDTRDGNFEIYFKALQSQMTTQQVTNNLSSSTIGSAAGTNCSGWSGLMNLADISALQALENISIIGSIGTFYDGTLAVSSSLATLTPDSSSLTDFVTLGVQVNGKVSFITGQNRGGIATITAVQSRALTLSGSLKADAGFDYSIYKATGKLNVPDTRLTCNNSTSVYPDIEADSAGRFHIVFQDNASGHYEIQYIQVFPVNVGQKTPLGAALGAISTTSPGQPQPTRQELEDGKSYSYGDASLADPLPDSVAVAFVPLENQEESGISGISG